MRTRRPAAPYLVTNSRSSAVALSLTGFAAWLLGGLGGVPTKSEWRALQAAFAPCASAPKDSSTIAVSEASRVVAGGCGA
jgi:hypothetical protein